MNYAVLSAEISTDPLERGYAAMSDQQVADSLNTADREVADPTQYTVREYFRRYGLDEAMVAAIKAAAPTVGEIVTDFGGDGGLDFSTDLTRTAIDQLQVGAVLTETQAANLKALGRQAVSRATELGIVAVTDGHVGSARQAGG